MTAVHNYSMQLTWLVECAVHIVAHITICYPVAVLFSLMYIAGIDVDIHYYSIAENPKTAVKSVF
jgi:hypothetical protein